MSEGRFIVSTGRCGSTLLSDLLRQHPAVLSLSEFLSSLHSTRVPAFPEGTLTGPETWRQLTTPRPEVNLLLMQRCADGVACAARGLDLGRIPPLLMGPLPSLTPDPVGLQEELRGVVEAFPAGPVEAQYSRVFDWLCGRLGREVWVERSGGSTWFVEDLVRRWPRARYVHLVRDGRDVACSMSRNDGFRMVALLDELGDGVADPARLVRAIASGRSASIPVERFGDLWSRQAVAADRRLRTLPAEQLLVLRYEELVADPAGQLRRLAAFLGLDAGVSERWAKDVARRVGRPRAGWRELQPDERGRLAAACEPGLRQLGYAP